MIAESDSMPVAAALIATLTPWLVARVVHAAAAAHARQVDVHVPWPRSGRLLSKMTPIVAGTAIGAALLLPAPSLTASAAPVLAFAVLAVPALRALQAIDGASLPSRVQCEAVREASLAPRRSSDIVSWHWRALPYAIVISAVPTFIVRASASAPEAEIVPSGFALAAVAFLFLYEVWLRDLVKGPLVGPAAEERRRLMARRVFVAELVLVVVSVGAAHTLLDVDWARPGVLTVALTFGSAIVAVVGCALALASAQLERRYPTVEQV